MTTPDLLTSISRRAIVVAGVLLASVILGGTALAIALLRQAAMDRAQENLSNLSAALAEQTRRSIQAVDLVVTATVRDFDLSGPALYERLRERAAALPELQSIAVMDRTGAVINHSRQFPPPAANYGDRDYFALHRDRAAEGMYIGVPVLGRLVPGWQLTYSRRVENRQGEFSGVASAAIRIDRLYPFYQSLRLGPGGRVTIFRADGVLLNTYPPAEATIGRSLASNPLFAAAPAKANSGFLIQTGFVDAEPRLIAYERLHDYPLVVAVSSTERHALSEWREGAVRLGVAAGALSLLVGLAVALALRQKTEGSALRDELHVSAERLHGVVQSAMDAIISVDENEKIALFNAAAERIFGCPVAEAIGGPLDRFIPERFRAAHHGHIRRFAETGATTRMMGPRLDLFGLRANGEEFPIDASISQVMVEGHRLFTVILRDVSGRKAAEEALRRSYDELREMSAVMNEVREAERTRIARELHDELAQWLTAVKMDVSWLAARLPKEEGHLVQRTEKMRQLVDTTVTAVRRIAADLRPVMLDDLGLVPSIEHLLHTFSERSGVTVSLDAPAGDVPAVDPLVTGVFRMVQEALTNIARHAHATEVRVTLGIEGDNLLVEVRDNGRGLGTARSDGKSYGLLGIRERAQTLGGSARIYSPESGGTIVEISLPQARYREREGA